MWVSRSNALRTVLVALALIGTTVSSYAQQDADEGRDGTSDGAVERRVGDAESIIEHGHQASELPVLDPSSFTMDALKRIQRLEQQIICACPRENWTRTLTNCPDSCADPQKRVVREMVRSGRTDADIRNWMRGEYGSRAIGVPEGSLAARVSWWLPVAIFGFCGIVGGLVLVSWSKRPGAGDGTSWGEDGTRNGADVSDADIAEIERELREID